MNNEELQEKLTNMVDEQSDRLRRSGSRWTQYVFGISVAAIFAAGVMLYSASSIQPKDVYEEVQTLAEKVEILYAGIRPGDIYAQVKLLEEELVELKGGVQPKDVYAEVQKLQDRIDLMQAGLFELQSELAPLLKKLLEKEAARESLD